MNNSIFNALNYVDDRHIRAEELAALDPAYADPARAPKLSKTLYVVLAAAAAAAVLCIGASAGAAMARGFIQEKGFSKFYKQPTLSFSAADAEDCPETIERFYLPSVIPEDYAFFESGVNNKKTWFTAEYVNETDMNLKVTAPKIFRFIQWTKAEFSNTYLTPDYVEVSETSVNGCPAYLLVEEHYFGSYVTIVWDSGDYIMEISCVCPVDEAMRAAESVK